MNAPVRMALPVPAAGTALNGSGEAYIASLRIFAQCDETNGGIGTATTGDIFETLLTTVGMRAKAFHPRTFAFTPFSIDAPKFAAMLERNWSSIDASGPDVVDLADILAVFGKNALTVSFRQVN